MKPKIKEVIVVEGKDDVSALRRAVEADILITTGLGLTEKRIEEIRVMAERQGVIVFTDPDFPGGKIRHILKDKIPGCKHAYITKDEARCPKTGKYGVEYASPEAILRALKAAKAEQQEYEVIYELNDLVQWGLAGLPDSAVRRKNLCEQLSIGECNAKQLVKKLNSYQISREEIEKLL
ncbi:MAG: ribonuclease M5 [Peptococcaceae bacterium]|nr:ribonuclease M5 [Peptococcaceae bacterium]